MPTVVLASEGPNAEQITYWNEQGPKWVNLQAQLDLQLRPLGERAIERAAVSAGERVLDIGCGCGETTFELARRTGAAGAAVGMDISTLAIERARQRADEARLEHVRFENADAQTFAFPPGSLDLLFSRFGVMFFSDPVAAFTNLRAALRPGGRLAFVCWQGVQRNPWMMIPLAAVAQHVALPAPPVPGAPGPFAFADADRVRGILTQAGFTAFAVEAVDEVLAIGGDGTLDQAVDFVLKIGPVAAALRTAGESARAAAAAAVHDAVAPFHSPQGVRMGAAAWLVTARA
jgi:SAM-dependent methyltransferase